MAVETKQQVAKQAKSKAGQAKLAKVRKANRYSVAVIIGNKNYQNKVPKVAFAHNDADAMRAAASAISPWTKNIAIISILKSKRR